MGAGRPDARPGVSEHTSGPREEIGSQVSPTRCLAPPQMVVPWSTDTRVCVSGRM